MQYTVDNNRSTFLNVIQILTSVRTHWQFIISQGYGVIKIITTDRNFIDFNIVDCDKVFFMIHWEVINRDFKIVFITKPKLKLNWKYKPKLNVSKHFKIKNICNKQAMMIKLSNMYEIKCVIF